MQKLVVVTKPARLTIASAAAFLMASLTGHAADMADQDYGMPTKVSFGEVEARAGGIWLDGDPVGDNEDDEMFFGGAAVRVGTVLENRWIIQGDVFGELTDSDDDDSYAYGIGGAAHIAKRYNSFLLGVFGGYLHTDQDIPSDNETSGRAFAGLEAQRYYDNVTLYGQAGWLFGEWGNDDDGFDSVSNALIARAMMRYFVNPATRLDVSVAGFYGQMDDDFEDETRGGSLTALLEHQVHDSNFSVFSGYELGYYYQQEDGGETDEIFEHTLWAGLKYRFGVDGTLQQQDRDRPSLDLPPLLRWVAQTGGPME